MEFFRGKTVRITVVVLTLAVAIVAAVFLRDGQRYREAMSLAEVGQVEEAYAIFVSLGAYSDAAARASLLVEADPAIPFRLASRFDTVSLGTWEQDNDTSNGGEPIRWIVLEKFDDQLLLLCAESLEGRQYHHVPFEDVTWERSDLRAWMNADFYEAAFAPADQRLIRVAHNDNDDQSITGAEGGEATDDRVFALSETQAGIYLNSAANRADIGAGLATERASSGGLNVTEDGTADWWLRSPGTYGFAAQFVDASGSPVRSGANVDAIYGVRPALWIDISKPGEAPR